MKLPNERWEEIEPCVYRLRNYTARQIEALNTRPTAIINSVMAKAQSSQPARPSHD